MSAFDEVYFDEEVFDYAPLLTLIRMLLRVRSGAIMTVGITSEAKMVVDTTSGARMTVGVRSESRMVVRVTSEARMTISLEGGGNI